MKLLYQTHSPYARKVLVMAHEVGLADRIQVIHQETSPTQRNDEVYALNPLGKVPVLVAGDLVLFDSIVICEYLDGMHGSARLIPDAAAERFPALRMQSLAQGLCDAGIALRWETERRPEALRYPPLRDGQTAKLIAGYDFAEKERLDGPLHIGHIALATALSWLEFRNLPSFREGRPRLVAWYDAFAARPSMLATPLSGQTRD
jgi:glutathione S-transferase